MNTWFTSDLHLHHNLLSGIRGYGYDDSEEMTSVVIDRYNSKISKNDTVYILGDFALVNNTKLPEVVKKLNGKKHLILGNHDNVNVNHNGGYGFESIYQYKEVKIGEHRFILFHYPILSWHWIQNPKVFHLFGHVHGNMDESLIPYKCMDVGVDTNDLYPYHIDEVISHMETKKTFSYDN